MGKLIAVATVLLSISPQALSTPVTVKRDDNVTTTLKDHMVAFLVDFLSTQNVDQNAFTPVSGFTYLDFYDPKSGDITDEGVANQAIFGSADYVRTSQPIKSFSQNYLDMLQDAQKLSPVDNSTNAELKQYTDAEHQACLEDLPSAADDAVKDYKKFGQNLQGDPMSDQKFLSWAQQNDDTFNLANMKCADAKSKTVEMTSTLKGDNYAIFSTIFDSIGPLIKGGAAPVPGLSMDVTPQSNGTSSGTPTTGAGNLVPYYNMTGLNGLMQSWISSDNSGIMDGNPQYTYDSAKLDVQKLAHSVHGEAQLGGSFESIISAEVSVSHEEREQTYNYTASSVNLSFGGIQLVPVTYGSWFDNWRAVSAIETGSDDKSKKMQPAVDKAIGTKDKPTSGAVRNTLALVGYKPKISVTFDQQTEFDSFSKTEVKVQACLLGFICVGGSGGNESVDHQEDKEHKSNTFTIPGGHIIGYVTENFFDSSNNSTA